MFPYPASRVWSDLKSGNHRLNFPVAATALQIVAAAFFVYDAFEDQAEEAAHGIGLETIMEVVIALGLFAGIVLSAMYVARLVRSLRDKEQTLARARGALGDHITSRFGEWGLTLGESEVALFALKGCDITEIARLRGAASGTIRSQLSQVYAKAGVNSQAMFVSLFIEDLLDVSLEGLRL